MEKMPCFCVKCCELSDANKLHVYKLQLASAAGSSEPTWYKCNDDKVKAMPQHKLEKLLSRTRRIPTTPYILFYARFDLKPEE
ncbi:GH12637 [Drosophila grimshawi]|uniref:GH12637 n=1 Tax=Drosophila grimshawi TaxID=7222 RepID=B4JKC7_DROGR|nr:GH12637 [Drosophila grimshawi]